MMGLLDFLKGLAEPRVTLQVTMQKGPSFYSDETAEEECRTPAPLRKLRTYDEKVEPSCGFDFSAVRRWHGDDFEWWAEGANYDRIVRALEDLRGFESEVRDAERKFPHIVDKTLELMRPYSQGTDEFKVPRLVKYKTKDVTGIQALIDLESPGLYPRMHASLTFQPDGRLFFAALSYSGKKYEWWKLEVRRYKRDDRLAVKSATLNKASVLNK